MSEIKKPLPVVYDPQCPRDYAHEFRGMLVVGDKSKATHEVTAIAGPRGEFVRFEFRPLAAPPALKPYKLDVYLHGLDGPIVAAPGRQGGLISCALCGGPHLASNCRNSAGAGEADEAKKLAASRRGRPVSYVGVHEIAMSGQVLESADDIGNSHRFYVAVWKEMMRIHGKPSEDALWASVVKLPRADAIVVAATFDRCWFPIDMIDEVSAAMRAETRFSSNMAEIAGALDKVDRARKGFCFSTSLANTWSCGDDSCHRIAKRGHKCTRCKKAIQNASHLVSRRLVEEWSVYERAI